jgi:hypothetical protein
MCAYQFIPVLALEDLKSYDLDFMGLTFRFTTPRDVKLMSRKPNIHLA